jgi:hypothetical protein
MSDFKEELDKLTPQQLVEVNNQLAHVAEVSEAHRQYYKDCDPEELTLDDEGLLIIEDAYLFLYEAWKTFMKTEKLH